MPKLVSIATACAVAAALSACALPNNDTVARQWDGHNVSEAVAKLGPPTRVVEMPGSKSMYIWETVYVHGQYLCSKGLTTDANGTVTSASQSTQSLLCR
jgi:hypothetical protein